MDNFFVVRRVPRLIQTDVFDEYKYLDQSKVYDAIEEATTVDELIPFLKVLQEDDDTECDHIIADDILVKALRMLDQNELADEYEKIGKWYS